MSEDLRTWVRDNGPIPIRDARGGPRHQHLRRLDPNLREVDRWVTEVERAAQRARLALHAVEDNRDDPQVRTDALQALAEASADGLDHSRELLKLTRRDSRR